MAQRTTTITLAEFLSLLEPYTYVSVLHRMGDSAKEATGGSMRASDMIGSDVAKVYGEKEVEHIRVGLVDLVVTVAK